MGETWDRKPARKYGIRQSPLKGDGRRAWPIERGSFKNIWEILI